MSKQNLTLEEGFVYDCCDNPLGYLLNQDKDSVLLGFMLFGSDMVKHNQLIPKGMIKNMRYLKCDGMKKQK